MQATPQGARLAYVVKKLEGTVKENRYSFNRRNGKLVKEEVDVPAGFLVFFPRGHYLRIRNIDDLRHYKLDKAPGIISMNGLIEPNTPVGRLMQSQDEESRAKAYTDLEAEVAAMVRKVSGPMSMPNYSGKLPIPTKSEEVSYV